MSCRKSPGAAAVALAFWPVLGRRHYVTGRGEDESSFPGRAGGGLQPSTSARMTPALTKAGNPPAIDVVADPGLGSVLGLERLLRIPQGVFKPGVVTRFAALDQRARPDRILNLPCPRTVQRPVDSGERQAAPSR